MRYAIWGGVNNDVMTVPEPGDPVEDETNKLVWIAIIYRLIDGFERIAKGEHICISDGEYEAETLALFEQVLPSLWT